MKNSFRLICLVSLTSLFLACSQSKDHTTTPTAGENTQQSLSMGKTASDGARTPQKTYFQHQPVATSSQRFTPGGAADDGVVVESRQIKREVLNRGQAGNGKDYLMEVESVNHIVSQRKTSRRRLKEIPAYSSPAKLRKPAAGTTQPTSGDKGGQAKPKPEPKFTMAMQQPLSTFSADVDTASYSNVRRELLYGKLPHRQLVRVEEMLNYFHYDLPEPEDEAPFSVTTELSSCPWSSDSQLMRVAIKTAELRQADTPPRNLVFLLDVSGSMNSANKLPLLKSSLRTLVDTLDDNDRVAIVVYAGASGVVLPSTTGDQKTTILGSINRLNAGGSTNGASGIQLAYAIAEENASEGSVNRVILATDGDFNVGISSREGLKQLIEEKRKSGLFLSVLGFGRHSNDRVMETLADNGNGNYASIDSLNEARKVLVKEAGATLVTVAKDVKFQVAFDPAQVTSYRLIGYKNRRLAARDFRDDTKDAGEVGAGHSVTALYELKVEEKDQVDRWLDKAGAKALPHLATVKLRYKAPDADTSQLREYEVSASYEDLLESSADQRWSAAVAGFGLLLEGELSTAQLSFPKLYELMEAKMDNQPDSYQAEFFSLVKKAEGLMK